MSVKTEYKRLRKNLQAKRRYMIVHGAQNVPEIPSIPKKITKGSVNRLKKFDLRKGTFYIGESGKQITPARAEYERRRSGQKKAQKKKKEKEDARRFAIHVVQQYKAEVNQGFQNIYMKKGIFELLNSMESEYGIEYTAAFLQDSLESGYLVQPQEYYEEYSEDYSSGIDLILENPHLPYLSNAEKIMETFDKAKKGYDLYQWGVIDG